MPTLPASRSARWFALLALTACPQKPEPEPEPPSSEWSTRCEVEDAIELGVDGEFTAHTESLELAFDSTAQIFQSDSITFALPEDVVSFAATVDLPGQETGFGWVAFDDAVWIDGSLFDGQGAWYTEPYFHWAVSGGTIVAPVNVETTPSGCLVLAGATLEAAPDGALLHVVTRRGDPEASAVIDLNIAVVGDTVAADDDIQAALVEVERVWRGSGGPGLGDHQIYSVPGDTFLAYADSTALRRTPIDAARAQAVNVFLIQDYLAADGTLGEAGGIPGPVGLQEVDEAGVIVSMDAHLRADGTLDTTLLGGVLAHEVGHQLGLFHTTESDGSSLETLDDTPDCPASADANGDGFFTAAECRDFDGTNFMFWAAGNFDQSDSTPSQAFVLSRSPVAHEP